MIKMYVMHTCPDCEYVEKQVEGNQAPWHKSRFRWSEGCRWSRHSLLCIGRWNRHALLEGCGTGAKATGWRCCLQYWRKRLLTKLDAVIHCEWWEGSYYYLFHWCWASLHRHRIYRRLFRSRWRLTPSPVCSTSTNHASRTTWGRSIWYQTDNEWKFILTKNCKAQALTVSWPGYMSLAVLIIFVVAFSGSCHHQWINVKLIKITYFMNSLIRVN